MSSIFPIAFISEAVIKAISYTLVHSLWQGMILALVAGLIILLTRSGRPSTRYNALAASLFGFTLTSLGTFWVQLRSSIPDTSNSMDVVITGNPVTNAGFPTFAGSMNLWEQLLVRFNAYAGWLVFGWMAIILIRSLQLTAGLLQVHQLKTSQVSSVGHYWDTRVKVLCRQIGLNDAVRLLESGRVQVPAVIGFFKPVILVPVGLLSQMSPEEVEAIILHELAHIRRKDYLVNVLQHSVEIIFFFNPAVRWVSSLIKAERENCCDEIAVAQAGSKTSYINALVSFHQKIQDPLAAFVPAFAGETNHLLNRVKRIIYNNNKTLNNMEKKFLAAGLIVTSLFFVAFTSADPQPATTATRENAQQREPVTGNTVQQSPIAEFKIASDTLPEKPQKGMSGTINTTVNGKKYKIVTKNNDVLDLYVDDQQISADKISEHRPVINRILKQTSADMANAEKEMEQAQVDMITAEKEIEKSQKELANAAIELEKAQASMEKDMEKATRELDESKTDMEQSKKEMAAAKLEIEQAKKDMKRDMASAKLEIEEAKKTLAESKVELAEAKKDIELAKKDIAESKKMQESIIADFVKEKLVSSKSALNSYQLNNEELIINGVKQSAEIHKKFKAKYVKGQNWSVNHDNE